VLFHGWVDAAHPRQRKREGVGGQRLRARASASLLRRGVLYRSLGRG
jgi:hypothetical protein